MWNKVKYDDHDAEEQGEKKKQKRGEKLRVASVISRFWRESSLQPMRSSIVHHLSREYTNKVSVLE